MEREKLQWEIRKLKMEIGKIREEKKYWQRINQEQEHQAVTEQLLDSQQQLAFDQLQGDSQ